ncbi:carbohydrate kinase family protein [Manganibacter manganicus]|uniref:Carbohydrate kinase n=1 Tax=Manganibacter manganicus TaxID=1873176 RepID=A0A1V8RTX9_9HYPH|nr:carbohydrate kinase family protein [Pseudaminobacter manganicus]OQM76652.1 carbohydrate kinase [Pseudaminobacter manganicus]
MRTKPDILAVGGAHIDRRGQISDAYAPAASNPGTMREDVGGGVFNALRTAVRRGASASLLSMRGGDAAGETVAMAITRAGIADLSAVFLDRATPSYTALIDREGELIVGLADMSLYDLAFPKQIRRSKIREAIATADALFCDANLPQAALERLALSAEGKPIFAIAISPAKAVRLVPVFSRLTTIFLNRREAAALTGQEQEASMAVFMADLRQAGLNSGVITDGSNPVFGFDADGGFTLAPPPLPQIADVTGAGDALAGATVAAMLRGLPLRAALREGVAAAALAIGSPLAVPEFTESDFETALALVPSAREMA